MPKIDRLLESALYVDDLERSATFYEAIFGFPRIHTGDRLIAMSVLGQSVLLLFKKGASAQLPVSAHDGHGQQHLAFAVSASEIEAWVGWLDEKGIRIEEDRVWERGGRSLYFRDPDQHLLEVASPGVWSIY